MRRAVVMLLLFLLLSGCSGKNPVFGERREIEQLVPVETLGVDRTGETLTVIASSASLGDRLLLKTPGVTLARAMRELAGTQNLETLYGTMICARLAADGYLEICEPGQTQEEASKEQAGGQNSPTGKRSQNIQYRPTEKGIEAGITEEEKISQKGTHYMTLSFDENMQKQVLHMYVEMRS